MDTQIIVVFCLCANMLKSLHHHEDRQRQMSDAEVMTTAIVAMLYFYGLRIHIMVTEQGEPVEFFLETGAFSDTRALGLYNFDLSEGSFVTGDKAYNNFTLEDVMREAGFERMPLRKRTRFDPCLPI